jgi:hypothetical protein
MRRLICIRWIGTKGLNGRRRGVLSNSGGDRLSFGLERGHELARGCRGIRGHGGRWQGLSYGLSLGVGRGSGDVSGRVCFDSVLRRDQRLLRDHRRKAEKVESVVSAYWGHSGTKQVRKRVSRIRHTALTHADAQQKKKLCPKKEGLWS